MLQKDETIKKEDGYYKSKVKDYIIKDFYATGSQPAALTLERTYADKMMNWRRKISINFYFTQIWRI